MLKKADPKIAQKVKLLMDATQHMQRGQIITYEFIKMIANIERGIAPFSTVMNKVRRRWLDERGVAMSAINNMGFRLLPADEQARERIAMRNRRAGRQIDRGIKELETIPSGELDDVVRNSRASRIDAMKYTRNRTRLQNRRDNILLRKSNANC